jgi:hypothetical protein
MASTVIGANFQREMIKAFSHLKEPQDSHHMDISFVRDSTNLMVINILVGAWR